MPTPPAHIWDSRSNQMFPKLSPAETNRLLGFGHGRGYATGEAPLSIGEAGRGLSVVLSGGVAVTPRPGEWRGAVHGCTRAGGPYMGELAQLSGRPALVGAHALGPVEALVMRPGGLRLGGSDGPPMLP